MKFIGAALIIFVTTWGGFEFAKKLRERPQQLRQLKVAIQSLESEIVYGLSPLAIACDHIAKQMSKPIAYLFERFALKLTEERASAYEAWRESVEEMWVFTSLLEGEKEVLLQFGSTLGQHNRQQQQKHIKLTLAHLEREELEARERQVRYERMVKSLGFLTGLLIVILMM